jgi:hypothetical protein
MFIPRSERPCCWMREVVAVTSACFLFSLFVCFLWSVYFSRFESLASVCTLLKTVACS